MAIIMALFSQECELVGLSTVFGNNRYQLANTKPWKSDAKRIEALKLRKQEGHSSLQRSKAVAEQKDNWRRLPRKGG